MNDMNKVYVVWDTNNDEIVSVHRTEQGARAAVLAFLKDKTGYTADEWEQFASDNGYDTVEEFQEAISKWPDYDEELYMMVETAVVKE